MAKTFEQATKRIGEVFFLNAVEYHREFSATMLREIARDTPVDEGFATANWVISIDKPDLTPKNDKDKTKTAIKTYRRALGAVENSRGTGSLIYINNAVQGRDKIGKPLKSGKRSTKRFDSKFNGDGYIIGLDHGKSKQAPNGMVLKNIVQTKTISKKVIRKLKR